MGYPDEVFESRRDLAAASRRVGEPEDHVNELHLSGRELGRGPDFPYRRADRDARGDTGGPPSDDRDFRIQLDRITRQKSSDIQVARDCRIAERGRQEPVEGAQRSTSENVTRASFGERRDEYAVAR